MEEKFLQDLLKDERIQWSGQPETAVIFSPADIFLVPFSLLWGGFAIFWEISVLSIGSKSSSGSSAASPLFGILFVLIGLYLIFGRFLFKSFRKKKTYYAITNKRVIVVTEMMGRNVQAEFIDRISSVNKSIQANGIGTIRFGSSNMMLSMYGNTGMEFFGDTYFQNVPAFYDIKEASKVYNLIMELMTK